MGNESGMGWSPFWCSQAHAFDSRFGELLGNWAFDVAHGERRAA